ncbi:MAG: hypothetical protein EZS28_031260 [Streblomastix strix]|uniref:Uncharacterized protein n=1 Tax=Streblomastix strix TaxID=222440 RepID=A0A5J4USL6_9EUKA|nr:MAG: hypothetical protein EZS28_031260 [Streblomastix strix]
MDMWNVNGKAQFEAQSYVYETVKNQTNLIEAGVQGLNRTNYLNSEIKLVDELAIYKANRAAYFIKDGPFITYSFGAKLAQLGANYEAQQTEFSAMCLFKDLYDKSSAVQVAVSGQLNMLDCEFQETYIIDNYTNESAPNEASNEAVSDSFIDEIIIKHEKQLVGKGLQWANDNVYKPFIKPFAKPIFGALGPVGQTIGKGLDVASSFLDYGYGADKNGQFRQDFETLRNDEYL